MDEIPPLQVLLGSDDPLTRAQKIVANIFTLRDKFNELILRASGANIPPVAAFTFTQPDTMSVAVSGSSSSDLDGTIAAYAWDFGDGKIAEGATATHTYSTAGVYTVTLTVTDDRGATASVSRPVAATAIAAPANEPPTPAFTVALAADGYTVSVDASGSRDPDGTIAAYAWSFGDGSMATGKTASHAYSLSGTFAVKLTVTDDGGATASLSKSITVTIPTTPPNPTPTPGKSGDPGVNRTGIAGQQQTATGVLLLQNLAGSTLTDKVKSAAGSGVSFAAGTFSFSDFLGGVDGGSSSSGNTGSGLQFPSGGTRSILGAGSASTVLQMNANSSSRGGSVPAQGSGSTNQLQYVDLNALPDGFLMDGIKIAGTAQGHLYNGLRLHAPGNGTLQNSTITGIPGNAGSPPGETFMANVFAQAAGKTLNFTNMTFDGNQGGTGVGAALLGTNNTAGVINITDCLFKNNTYSSTVTIWELQKGGVINIVRPVIQGRNHRSIGNEAQAGTINIYDPLFVDPDSGEDDIRVTWTSNFNSGTINVYFTSQANWNAFIAQRSNKKLLTICSVKQAYGGSAGGAYTGSNDIRNFCHLFIGGVEQNKANYWSFTGQPVN